MEVRATENRHWKAPLRGPATEPDTKGRVRCPPCCVRAVEKPLGRAGQPGDGAVFSTAAIEPPVAVAGPNGPDLGALPAFHRSRNSCATPVDTGLTPPSSFPD